MFTKDDAKKQLLQMGLLIKSEETEEYCKSTGLQFKKLKNGITYFGIQKDVGDSQSVSLDLQYNFGSYYDPLSKEGMTHLIEHLWFSEKFNKFLIENHVSKNGWTSARALNMSASGTWNLDFENYSIPEVLNEVIHNFFYHDNIDSEKHLNEEFEVINREIEEADTDFFKYSLREKFFPLILPGHEVNVNVLGKKESLQNIGIDDLKKFTDEKFTTANAFVKYFEEGTGDKLLRSQDELFKQLEKINPSDKISPPVPEYSFDPLDFPIGEHRLDTEAKFKDRVLGIILFPMQIKIPDKMNYALTHFDSRFNDDLFVKVRKNGLAYSASILNLRVNSEYILYGAYFVSTKDKVNDLCPRFTKEFFNVFQDYLDDPKLIEREVELESLRQSATPSSKQAILDDSAGSFVEFGLLSNIYKYREMISGISVDDMLGFSKQILDSTPTNILIGDLD